MAAFRYHFISRVPSSCRSGMRRRRVSSEILASSIARRAPRQPCGPWPKLRVGPRSYVMSKQSGSGKREGSRLAEAMLSWTIWPARIVSPRSSISSRAMRGMRVTGGS